MSDDRGQTADPVPSTIGRYQITGTLGFGAMGAVYKAHDEKLDRIVAILLGLLGLTAAKIRAPSPHATVSPSNGLMPCRPLPPWPRRWCAT